MKASHFEKISPVCPVCRVSGRGDSQLKIASIFGGAEEDIIFGLLLCSDALCQMEYPIIDGIPVIHANVRGQVESYLLHLVARNDLPAELDSLLSDAAGPGTAFDSMKQALSTYSWDHYGDLDPDFDQHSYAGKSSENTRWKPGSAVRCLNQGLSLVDDASAGLGLDLGCAVGRTTFTLAEHRQSLVLGVDLNFSMLRVASRALREGRLVYPIRQGGVVYEQREFLASFEAGQWVDFWCCDALCLPFSSDTFSFVSALNIIDCVSSPLNLLQSLENMITPGGFLAACSPYDWSPVATPVEGWLGGHSQRSVNKGDSARIIEAILTMGELPASLEKLQLTVSLPEVPWSVRVHQRHFTDYRTHLVVARKDE